MEPESAQRAELEHSSVMAWILLNGFVNEYNKPLEFVKHRFLLDYLEDNNPVIVTKKAAQIGMTVAETVKSFHLAAHRKLNIIHTLQTADVIKGFVAPKVNPIIEYNPNIKKMIKMDSESLKQVGENFIFYRGAQSESQAINITADVLIIDEYDRSNQKVVEMYKSRLDASEYKWQRYFSNPSAIGFGVDGLYNQSDQRYWMVTCSHCGHQAYMDFEQDDTNCHYLDIEQELYVCGKCELEIYDKDRINGEWIAKYPDRNWHGYWFSQMMVPSISAAEILEKQQNSTTEFFYNFVLGKAYTPTDLVVSREKILRATKPLIIAKNKVAIGVDNGVTKHWVAATPQGVFAYGKTNDWKDIERLILMYNATMVIDALPDFTIPKRLVEKYKGKVFINYYKQDTKNLGTVRWGENKDFGVVYSDRTKIMDMVATEISEQKILFRMQPHEMNEFITHWENTFRTLETDDRGAEKGDWVKQGPDHFAHATNYMRIALSRVLGGTIGMDFVEPGKKEELKIGYVDNRGRLHTDLGEKIEEALNGDIEVIDWRHS